MPTLSGTPAAVAAYDPVPIVAQAATTGAPGAGYMANDFNPAANGGEAALPGVRAIDTNDYVERVLTGDDYWTWQLLPTGLMYKTYLASPTEPRMGSRWGYNRDLKEWVWNATLGARIGIFRYGTNNDIWPQGWQLDMEGASFPRLDDSGDVVGNDYIFGMPLTMRQGAIEWKLGYRHYCSHIADEYLLKNPGFHRLNYVRDSFLFGVGYYLSPSLRLYCEADWAFNIDDGALPWHYQFGVDFSPPGPTTNWGAPFLAANCGLRQENDFGGNFTVQTGWQWRGHSGHLLRIGAHYFNGMSDQAQFYYRWEEEIGFGIWYDF